MATSLSLHREWRRLRWEWQRQRLRLPWMSALAGGLLVAALLFGFGAWQEWCEQATPEIVQPVRKAAVALSPQVQARADLDHFYHELPPAHALSAPIIALLRLGDKHGVHFSEGEYHTLSDQDSKVVQEDIVLPVEASPVAIQDFLHDALQSLRTLTVTGISFERDDVNMALVKARIHFVLVARAS